MKKKPRNLALGIHFYSKYDIQTYELYNKLEETIRVQTSEKLRSKLLFRLNVQLSLELTKQLTLHTNKNEK
jgi:hypothetical protein